MPHGLPRHIKRGARKVRGERKKGGSLSRDAPEDFSTVSCPLSVVVADVSQVSLGPEVFGMGTGGAYRRSD